MALARKGTRLITINQTQYRWTVAPDHEPGVAIVTELAENPGQRLVVWFDHATILAPGLVRHTILWALATEWQPHHPGPVMVKQTDTFLVQAMAGLDPENQN